MAAFRTRARPSWTPPDTLGEYRFVREIGRGAMGYVYRYEDTLLDRPVAVKFIAQRRPDEAARRRFLIEARAVARLQHPNIVAVHRVGEVEGHPYLVTELVAGRPLEGVPKPLPGARVIAIGLDLARGLSAAHRRGVLHRDIKPSNAIVQDDGDGEVKLIDFGLAVITHDDEASGPDRPPEGEPPAGSGSRLAGTPTYMAPEALRGEAATVRSDIYSLGAVLYELAAGKAPRDTLPPDADDATWTAGVPEPLSRTAPDIDPRLAAVILRCLSESPDERFPSADALADALVLLLAGPPSAAPEGNPYRGLASFEAAHRGMFFGRATESRAVVDRLRATAFAVVTGDSGVGKSSLCRAGVAPLVEEGALQDGRRYQTVTVLPGRHPYTALLAAIGATFGVDPAAEPAEEGRVEPRAFARGLHRLLGKGEGALIFIDQAEELLTLSDPEEARACAEALGRLPATSAGTRVLVAVRGDFFTGLAALPGLGEALDSGVLVLRPLSEEGVRAAITGPAAQHGVMFEPPDLVDELATAARGAAGGLPLLQFALAELWEARRGKGTITRDLLQAVGGVEGALARHAESVLAGLSPGARVAARRLLVSLVTPEGTARRRSSTELGVYSVVDKSALDALVRGRLLVAREIEEVSAYELAHEALLSVWGQLARWIDDSREERRLLHELSEAASFWERRGRRAQETWSMEELAAARHRARQLDLALPVGLETFLVEGERHHAARRRRDRVRISIGAALAAVVTIGSLLVAGELREQKVEAQRQTEALRLARGNLGRFELMLRPFDWQGRPTPVSVADLPELAWRFHAARPGDVHHPGAPLPAELVRTERWNGGGPTELVTQVEAPGGMVFLRVDGRGRAGERCAPSWIRVQSLPGYAERTAEVTRIVIDVPTCRATAANMTVIPAGSFVYGGPGEPATVHQDYVEPERTVELPEYSIDRTEVSNAAFQPFAALERLTGYPAPRFPADGPLQGTGAPDVPVTAIDAFTAEAFCRYLGKRLPGDLEWTKAARGGLVVDGRPNPHPRRLYPWGITPDDRCANADGDEDGSSWVAPASAYGCGASPYGVLNLAGNVAEWISREGQNDRDSVLRVVRGGAVDSPRGMEHPTTVFRNAREGRYFDFTIGVRCVAGGQSDGSEEWNE